MLPQSVERSVAGYRGTTLTSAIGDQECGSSPWVLSLRSPSPLPCSAAAVAISIAQPRVVATAQAAAEESASPAESVPLGAADESVSVDGVSPPPVVGASVVASDSFDGPSVLSVAA